MILDFTLNNTSVQSISIGVQFSSMEKVLVGMSGGIDSSVVAYLLKERGYEVHGVTMTLWNKDVPFIGDPTKAACFSPSSVENVQKAKAICDKIGIEHTVLDISKLYESVVLKNFKEEYLNGRTPNPCVWCNPKIKFGAMVDYAREAGIQFDYFATGHYARIEKKDGRYCLLRGVDPKKDQSYFLYRLSQKQLGGTLFPLGGMEKTETRHIDQLLGFHAVDQTESQDFYGGHYSDLLDVKPVKGKIVDTEGKVLGYHNGIWNYTIGQRKGLGVSAPRPLYVLYLDPQTNEVVVGYEENTGNTAVTASQLNWVSVDSFEDGLVVQAKIRSTGNPVECTLTHEGKDKVRATFSSPVKAATCGQSLVVYNGDYILFGGIIDSVEH